jgi:hypothetical protein
LDPYPSGVRDQTSQVLHKITSDTPAQFASKGLLRLKILPLAGKCGVPLSNAPTNSEVDMLTVLIPRSSRVVALGVAIAGASGVAGLLEPITGCLSLVLVVLFAHFLGRSFGRLAAGFTSIGIAGALLASNRSPPASDSISRCAVAIAAAWLCAELVSRRPPAARLNGPIEG